MNNKEKNIYLSLQGLISMGQNMLKTENYASQINEYFKLMETIVEYAEANCEDEELLKRVKDFPKLKPIKKRTSHLDFFGWGSLSAYRVAEDDIRQIEGVANNLVAYLKFRGNL